MPVCPLTRLLRRLEGWNTGPAAMLVYVDIRQMREINLWSEPGTGDAIIAQALRVLRDWAGKGSIATRLWSNEFVAVKAIDHGQSAIDEAIVLRERLCALRYASVLGDNPVGISMGLVTARLPAPWQLLVTQASTACAQAKRSGLNQISTAGNPSGDASTRDPAAARHFRQLRDAGRLSLFTQPVMDIRGGTPRLAKAEFLLRMRQDDGSYSPLPPGSIESIEHFGLSTELDTFTAQFVLDWIDASRDALGQLDGVTMNLSAKSLADARFMQQLFNDVRAVRPPDGKLGFEITETAAVEQLEIAADIIEDFRSIGCTFSLDDFGSGLCSFGYLHSLPVNEVKIDGCFIHDIAHNPLSQEIVRAISQVAHTAGKKVVAEFVDAPEKLTTLQRLDIDYAQGFLFHPALPPERLLELLAKKLG